METIELLAKHYREGMLPIEPNQKFEELRKRYLENPTDFSKVAVEALNKVNFVTEKILESDLEGSKIEFHQSLPVTMITTPKENAAGLMEKVGYGKFTALAIGKFLNSRRFRH